MNIYFRTCIDFSGVVNQPDLLNVQVLFKTTSLNIQPSLEAYLGQNIQECTK